MQNEVNILNSGAAEFPSVLSSSTLFGECPRVWIVGNPRLFNRRYLGFFCSRKCPGDVILQTYDLARNLRDAGVPVVGGFHSSMERECLELLLRGDQPIVVCPARGVERMRIPRSWQKGLAEERLLIVSPFEAARRRTTAALAEQRNRFVAAMSAEILFSHAEPGGKTDQLAKEILDARGKVWLLDASPNEGLCEHGATRVALDDVVARLGRGFGPERPGDG